MALKKETELSGWLCCTRPTEPCSFGFVSRKGTVVLFPSFSGRSWSNLPGTGLELRPGFSQTPGNKNPGIPLLCSPVPSFPHPCHVSPFFLSPFGKPDPAALLKMNKLRGKEHVLAGRMLSPSALLALPSAQQTAPAFHCARDAGTWTGGGFSRSFGVGTEGGRWALRLRGGCCLLPALFGHQKRAGIMV